jgi:hypothetical protein
MPHIDRRAPNYTGVASILAFICSSVILTLVMRVNYLLYGNAYVFIRQLITGVMALGIGSCLAVQAASVGRWRRCKVCGVLAAGLAVAGWWLVPNSGGHNLARLHYLTYHHQSELRSLPLGNVDRFRSGMTRRDQLVDLLPRIGRAIRAEEERWLTESLSRANCEAECLLALNPGSSLVVSKEALHDLPGPEKYLSDASPDQGGLRDEWQRAKQLRLKAAKIVILPRIIGNDYRAAAEVAAALRSVAAKDEYRDAELDSATEKFIDSVLFLDSLNDLGHGRSQAEH